MDDDSVQLTNEKETLFITLYAKVVDYQSKNSILKDKTAVDLMEKFNLDLTKYKGFGDRIMVVRAKQFDVWIDDYIKENSNAVIVYLGCGLDTRYSRINPPSSVDWFDIDYPEVIQFRRECYSENGSYKMIGSSVTDVSWFDLIPNDRPTLILAEGLLEYLTAEEVKMLFNNVTNYFDHGQMIFDVMNSFAIESGREKLAQTTGAVHTWAVDDINVVDSLNLKLRRLKVVPLFRSSYIRKLPGGQWLMLSLLSLFPKFKNMINLLKYEF